MFSRIHDSWFPFSTCLINMPYKTLLLLLFAASVCANEPLSFGLFKNQDRNHDGKLTHHQFIEGLNRAFMVSVIAMPGS